MTGLELRFRSDIVTPWGVFFSGIASRLRMEIPQLNEFHITLKDGDFPTAASVADGEADVGLTTPPVCATMAYRGIGPFSKRMENLRAIGSFPHDDRMIWAVPTESGINSIEDMPRKPLRLVIPGSDYPVRFALEKILELYGMSLDYLANHGWKILEDNQCLTIPENVIEGRADALIHEGRKTPAWRRLTESRLMNFLPIRDDVLRTMEREYGFRRAILSKGMLRGVEQDIACIDFSDWLMFVREDMPFDLARSLTKVFIEKRREIFEFYYRDIPPERSDLVYPIDPKKVWRNVGDIPLHPAAEHYYKVNGYIEYAPVTGR